LEKAVFRGTRFFYWKQSGDYYMSIAFLRHFVMRGIAFILSALLLGHALHSSGLALPLPAHAFAGVNQQTCDGCTDNAQRESALCGFKYMVFFFLVCGNSYCLRSGHYHGYRNRVYSGIHKIIRSVVFR
jgi:hypothetical protein